MPNLLTIVNFERTRALAEGTRWKRYSNKPARYCIAMAQKKLIYPLTGMTRKETASLFWGATMQVSLPSGTDIYLTGGRSDEAELRLTLYLLKNLKAGETFLDIGAHFGFYSLFAIHAGATVYALEPSPVSFEILKQNAAGHPAMNVFHILAGETEEQKDFCSFEPKYSEYDSVYTEQYADQHWFRKAKKQITKIRCTTLDHFTEENNIRPDHIKIDTEGSEYDIIRGAVELLKESNPVIIMEYLSAARGNTAHRKALNLLHSLGYSSYIISDHGELIPCPDPDKRMKDFGSESENVVLKRIEN